MNAMQRHMLRRLVAYMAAVSGVLTVVVLLVNPDGLFSLLMAGGFSTGQFLFANLLEMAVVLCHTAPLGTTIAVIFLYCHWIGENELMPLRNAGLSERAIALPGLAAAGIALAFTASITLYILPIAFGSLADMVYVASHNLSTSALRAGAANHVASGVTLQFRDWRSDDVIEDIRVLDRHIPGEFSLVRADLGHFTEGGDTAALVLNHGTRITWTDGADQPSTIDFDWLAVPLAAVRGRVDVRSRGVTWFEQHIDALLNPPAAVARDFLTWRGWVTEGHQRIIMPLLPLGYILFALGVLLVRQYSRLGMALRIVGLATSLALIHIAMVVTHSVVVSHPEALPLFYAYPILPGLIGILLLFNADHKWHRRLRRRGRVLGRRPERGAAVVMLPPEASRESA